MKVAITGATGFIGRALVRALVERGDEVLAFTRRPALAVRRFGPGVCAVPWTPAYDSSWGQHLTGCEAMINLAGEPIFGGRWTAKQKERILKSRTEATAGILEAMRRADPPPRILISSSAIGYYGPHGDEPLNELSPPGDDFLAFVCRGWEREASNPPAGIRVVIVRTGIVLGAGGGVLGRMVPAFRMFLGGPLGSGRQWVSWIHLADLVRMFLWAIDDAAVTGPLNCVAPHPVTNGELARAIGYALRRPAWFRAPAVALRLALGEAAEMILGGQRVMPARAQELGFTFRFPTLGEALPDILGPSRAR